MLVSSSTGRYNRCEFFIRKHYAHKRYLQGTLITHPQTQVSSAISHRPGLTRTRLDWNRDGCLPSRRCVVYDGGNRDRSDHQSDNYRLIFIIISLTANMTLAAKPSSNPATNPQQGYCLHQSNGAWVKNDAEFYLMVGLYLTIDSHITM